MKAGTFVDVAAAIVTVALVTALVNGRNTASVISSVGEAFSGSIRASLGR